MNCCTDRIDFCIIRGDSFERTVGLGAGWQEVSDAPAAWQARLVLRADQDDTLPEILTLTAPAVLEDPPYHNDVRVLFTFTATPTQTQELPKQTLVAFVELRSLTGNVVRRLFNSRVSVED